MPAQFERAAVLWRGCCCRGEETAVFRAVQSGQPAALLSALLRARTHPRHGWEGGFPQHRWQDPAHARDWSSRLPLDIHTWNVLSNVSWQRHMSLMIA